MAGVDCDTRQRNAHPGGVAEADLYLNRERTDEMLLRSPKRWEAALHVDEEDDRQVLLQRNVAGTQAVTEQKAKPLLIGQLAKLAGVKPDSVRFYERSGLLPKPERSPSGYRVYKPAAVNRLRFIKKAQALGFSLDEVRRILSLQGQGSATCRSVLAIAEATLGETEIKLETLRRFRDSLAANVKRWRKLPAQRKCAAEFCDLIESSAELP